MKNNYSLWGLLCLVPSLFCGYVQADSSLKGALAEAVELRFGLQGAQKNVDQEPGTLYEADFSLKRISQGEVRRLFLNSFVKDDVLQDTLLDVDGIEKLGILVGNSTDRSACLSAAVPTITAAGDVSAARMLATPETALEVIEQRQQCVAHVVANELAHGLLLRGLRKIAQGEESFSYFLRDTNKVEKEAMARVYWGGPLSFLNKSTGALAVLRLLQNLGNVAQLGFLHTGHFTGAFLREYAKLKPDSSWADYALSLGLKAPWEAVKSIGYSYKDSHTPWRIKTALIDDVDALKKKYGLPEESLGSMRFLEISAPGNASCVDMAYMFTHPEKTFLAAAPANQQAQAMKVYGFFERHSIATKAIVYGFYVGWDALVLWYAKRAYDNMALDSKIITYLQEQLIGVAHIIDGMRDIKKACALLPELQKNSDVQRMMSVWFESASLDVASMVSRLQAGTFKGDASYFSNFARILATYSQVVAHKDLFVDALKTIGQIDAYSAAARMVRSRVGSSAQYSFVHFVDQDCATIVAKNFWNPLMDADKAVVNSMELGLDGARTVMITGPNGSGKSVMMNSFAYNIILAQTFGIAAAQEFECTPFACLNIYRNVQESLQDDLSTFMAESRRLDQLCTSVKNLQNNQKSLTFVDEGLKGTVEQEGGVRLYDVAKDLSVQAQNITFFATHFYGPTKLGDEQPDVCRNIHMGVQEPTEGAFERSFRVVDGINRRWFEDSDWRGRFVNWLRLRVS